MTSCSVALTQVSGGYANVIGGVQEEPKRHSDNKVLYMKTSFFTQSQVGLVQFIPDAVMKY